MDILIIKANEKIFSNINPKLKFVESTKNTSIFKITEKKFIELRNKLRELGFNPYSIMSW